MTVRQGRQTGRSTKIATFAATQLFEIGHVVVTDHTTFEFNSVRNDTLMHLIERTKRIYYSMINADLHNENEITVEHRIIPAGHRGHNEMKVIHLWVESKRKSTEDQAVIEWVDIKKIK
jgi:hypothetical protein